MKKIGYVLLFMLLLTGCKREAQFETLENPCMAASSLQQQMIEIDLPEGLSAPVISDDEQGALYVCDQYTLYLQTLQGGDIYRTVKNCTGYSKDMLTLIETKDCSAIRYDCSWSAMGEKGQQIGRLSVIDDGCYHYVLSAMASSDEAETVEGIWSRIFGSFTIGTGQ